MSFILPLSTHGDGRKTLSLRTIYRARNWRARIREIEHAIVTEHLLERVRVSGDDHSIGDHDKARVFNAALRNCHVRILEFHDARVDYLTLLRVFETKNLERLTFYSTRFIDSGAVAQILQSNDRKLKYISFHWLDDGVLENAVTRSSRFHSSLKTLTVGFLNSCWKADFLLTVD